MALVFLLSISARLAPLLSARRGCGSSSGVAEASEGDESFDIDCEMRIRHEVRVLSVFCRVSNDAAKKRCRRG
jgi:hypothetical protein